MRHHIDHRNGGGGDKLHAKQAMVRKFRPRRARAVPGKLRLQPQRDVAGGGLRAHTRRPRALRRLVHATPPRSGLSRRPVRAMLRPVV